MIKITIEDLYKAYRKAKVDLYFSSNPPLFDMALYEDSLDKNLNLLLKKIKIVMRLG